jgi:type IV secretion/conjugal transfer VirB4 family ATPase
MVKLSRLLKDHADAGSLNEQLAVWGFVDDATFLTKAGAVGTALRLCPVDDACLESDAREIVSRRFAQALKHLDENYRLYTYLLKRPANIVHPTLPGNQEARAAFTRRRDLFERQADTFFTYDLVLVVLYEGWHRSTTANPFVALRDRFSVRRTMTLLASEIERASAQLQAKAQTLVAQLNDTLHPTPLTKDDVFAFLRGLANPAPHKSEGVTLKFDTHLDYFVADSTIECARDALLVDDYYVKVVTMKEPPARTYPQVLADLLAIPSRFVACLEWQRIPNTAVRRDLHARRRHHFNKKVSLVNYLNTETRPEEMLHDDSAQAIVTELGQALTDLEVNGHAFGACSLSVVLIDQDRRRLDQSAAACTKAFATHDGAVFDEGYNLLNAWLATMPGNSAHNLRRLALSHENVADLAPLFAPQTGQPNDPHLAGTCLAVLEAEHRVPYHWNLHYGDVGHALVLGATGAGKSFLMNFLLTQAQQYAPTTFIFDLGGSYDSVTRALGGSVWRFDPRQRRVAINPFSLTPTAANLHFLQDFVKVLMRVGGTRLEITTRDDREISDGVASLYVMHPAQRRLSTLARTLPRHLAEHLHRWTADELYSPLFDAVTDTLTIGELQCFDFQGMEDHPLVLEPLLFYVLHRANDAIRRDTDGPRLFTLFLLDEAWRFAKDPTVKNYIVEALKTWRKHNAALLLATQSDQDLVAPDLLRAVLDNCPTKVFLANPGIDLAHARERFHLTEREARRIADLRPREQLLLKRPDLSTVLSLRVDPESATLFSSGSTGWNHQS